MPFDPKKAGEEADQLIQKLNQIGGDEPASTEHQTAEEDGAIATAAVDQGVAPTGAEATPASGSADDPIKGLSEELRVANQRWKVLQGMLDRKDEEITNMRTLLAQLSQQQTAQAQAAQPAAPEGPVVTDKDRKEFDADLIDLMTRIAGGEVRRALAEFQNSMDGKLGELRSSVEGVTTVTNRTAQEIFFESLSAAVPNWEQVNVDPAFLNWLQVADPFTGQKRLDLLTAAYQEMDARRTAAFFVTFAKETGTATAAPTPTATAPAAPAAGKRSVSSLVTPGKSKATPPAASENGKIWTRAEISKLYDDRMRNAISSSEFDKLEADLFRAQTEGRIAA
jgi:hypothetical protein